MNLPQILNNAGWRTKFVVFFWFFGSIAAFFGYLTAFFVIEPAATILAYSAAGCAAFPLVIIPLLPMLNLLYRYLLIPILDLPATFLYWFGITPDVIPTTENGRISHRMKFGDWAATLIACLVFVGYYIGIPLGILVSCGVASPTLMIGTLALLTGCCVLFTLAIYGDSQKA